MGVEVLVAAGIAAAVSAGSYAVSYAFAGGAKPGVQDNARTPDPRVQNSAYGVPIARVYGEVELAGTVIWATEFVDTPNRIPGQSSKRGSTPDRIEHVYSRSWGVQVCAVPPGGAILGVRRITFDDKTFYESNTMGPILTDKLQIMLGDEDQAPSTWYEADRGVGQVSAHRGYLTLWFHDIDLTPYGDRIPNVRVTVVQAVSPTVKQVVEYECYVAGLSAGEVNASELSGKTLDGFFVNQRGPVRQSLEQLGTAFLFDGSEYDGKVNMRTRPKAAVTTVAWDELGWAEGDGGDGGGGDGEDSEEQYPPRLVSTRKPGAEIAGGVDVLYFDKERNFEGGSQRHTRVTRPDGEPVNLPLNLVAAPAEARRIAKVHAVVGWVEREGGPIALPPEFFVYAPGDVLSVPEDETETTFFDFRIERLAFAAPGVVRADGVRQYAEPYTQDGSDATPGEVPPEPPPVDDPPETDIWLDDRPPFRWGDEGRFGYYLAATGDPGWRGTRVFRDVDGAGDLREQAVVREPATMGTALTALPDHAAGLDTTNHVDVRVKGTAPVSITDDAFEGDQTVSLWAVGSETLQARDVTALGGNDYRLSHLRRSMHSTEGTGHVIGEAAVLLDHRVMRVEHNREEVGETYEFTAVTFGREFADGTVTEFTYGARGVEPGGDVPSAVEDDSVATLNGQQVLQWSPPLENTNTLRGYRITVYTDAAMTTPAAGFEDVEVAGNQFVLPGREAL